MMGAASGAVVQSTAQILRQLFAESRSVADATGLLERVMKHLSALPGVTAVAILVQHVEAPLGVRASAAHGLSAETLDLLGTLAPGGNGEASAAWPSVTLPPGLLFGTAPLLVTPEQVTVLSDGEVDVETLSLVASFLSLALLEQREAEADVAGRAQSHKLQAVGALTSGIAHDFNNVLAAILAHLELARLEPGLTDNADLLAAAQAAVRGRDLVRQMLVFGRPRPDARTPHRVQRIIEDSMGMIRSTMPSTVGLRLSLDPKTPAVLADPTQLQQVLVNLVTLAANGSPGRGTVDISLASRPGIPAGVVLTVSCEGDDGPVCDERGMGLSVVRTMIKAHGGTLEVKRASLVVSLPGIEGTAPLPLPLASVPGKQQRIALVDDEPLVARATERLVSQFGYQVTTFSGAHEVLRQFATRSDAFELVLTDQTMPDMTGLELTHALRAQGLRVPVLLVTGLPTEIDVRAVAPPFLVLGKPYRSEELASGLAQLLAR